MMSMITLKKWKQMTLFLLAILPRVKRPDVPITKRKKLNLKKRKIYLNY